MWPAWALKYTIVHIASKIQRIVHSVFTLHNGKTKTTLTIFQICLSCINLETHICVAEIECGEKFIFVWLITCAVIKFNLISIISSLRSCIRVTPQVKAHFRWKISWMKAKTKDKYLKLTDKRRNFRWTIAQKNRFVFFFQLIYPSCRF